MTKKKTARRKALKPNSVARIDAAVLLRTVVQYYLNSGDFNGYPARNIAGSIHERKRLVEELLKNESISLNFGDRHPNPHILAFKAEPLESQLEKLHKSDLAHVCLYPERRELKKVVKASKYKGQPFTHHLALGEPQLELVAFDLRVLEQYRNDPRYTYSTDDIQGSLSVSDKFFESTNMRKHDQVLLQNFGFGYDRNVTERVVMAFLRDLSGLSAEHQQIWNTHRLDGDYLPHPDFWRAMMGEWPERVSIFEAFVEELKHINEMCRLIGRPPLFRQDFTDDKRPRHFGFLIRPTLSEYNSFVHLLDKMISENINVAFFGNDIEMETLEKRRDGTFVARPKGTLSALTEWLGRKFRPADPKPLDEALGTLKRIRKLRQHPAHATHEDEFDQKFFRDQRDLIVDAYSAVRVMRLILANHPSARNHEVPEWLARGDIWTR